MVTTASYVASYTCLVKKAKTFQQSWSLKMDKKREAKLKTKVSKRNLNKILSDPNGTKGKQTLSLNYV